MALKPRAKHWNLPRDKHYSMLVAALRRKADEIVEKAGPADCEVGVAELTVVPESKNSAWGVLRLEGGAHSRLHLLYGYSNTDPELRNVLKENGFKADDIGVDVRALPFDGLVAIHMKRMSEVDVLYETRCPDCGHLLSEAHASKKLGDGCDLALVCDGCGYTDHDPEEWEID